MQIKLICESIGLYTLIGYVGMSFGFVGFGLGSFERFVLLLWVFCLFVFQN